MSKKSKRRVTTSTSKEVKLSSSSSSSSYRSTADEFNPDYSYVKKDLRRIGLLAGSFATILVILSIFLR